MWIYVLYVDIYSYMFPVYFFDGVNECKSLVRSLNTEMNQLTGDTCILFALKKGSSIGNRVVQNRQLSFPKGTSGDQHCKGRGCRRGPLVNGSTNVVINGNTLHIPRHLKCKSKNIMYMWICKLCGEKVK